ncbi:hypothetical protein EMMF5_002085 [Cystobasidiomycetes sp. EMM_F5]
MLFATAICALMTALSASATPLLNPRQNTAASPAGVLYSPLNGTTTFDGGKVNFTYVPEKSDTIYVNVAVVQFITVATRVPVTSVNGQRIAIGNLSIPGGLLAGNYIMGVLEGGSSPGSNTTVADYDLKFAFPELLNATQSPVYVTINGNSGPPGA